MSTPDPDVYNFFVYEGRDFARDLEFTEDIGGWTFVAMYDNDTALLPITITPIDAHNITLQLSSAEIAGLNKTKTTWDMYALDDNNLKIPLLEGVITKKSTVSL